jgi:hypothetical protein
MEKYTIKAVYLKGTKKKRIDPHQKKELTCQSCEMFIINVSLKNARHSETIEKRIIGVTNKIFFFVESRQTKLMQVVYNKQIPIIGFKQIIEAILPNKRMIFSLLFLGSSHNK